MVLISSPTWVGAHPHHPAMDPITLTHKSDAHEYAEHQQQHQHHQHRQQESVSEVSSSWVCPASGKSVRTSNPIRAIVDPIVANVKLGCQREDGKEPISLALGDPTVSDNLPPCKAALEAVAHALVCKGHAAGYVNACGTPEARHAIARYHSYAEHRITSDNVIMANGCSGALELALTALLDPGTAVLVPQPGFPLYQVIAESHGASVVQYRLLPDHQWQVDLDHLEEIMTEHPNQTIRAMIINNPSNPTGSVFSEDHLMELLDFARRHHLPIVSDEVYGELVFASQTFHPMALVAAKHGRHVPIITASGLAKQFLLPGWRVGWLTFHENIHGSLRDVEAGANRLAQVILGANHLAQTAIPTCLDPATPGLAKWKYTLRQTLERQATFLCTKLATTPSCQKCLQVVPPQGAMYAIIKIHVDALDGMIQNDVDFTRQLLDEENVFVLPGSAFGVQNVFRVVFCSPETTLAIAADRIAAFCHRHALESHKTK